MEHDDTSDTDEALPLNPTSLTRRGVLAGTAGLAFLPKYQSKDAGSISNAPSEEEESDGPPEHANRPISIGSRLELFVDDYLVESADGVRGRYHNPEPEEVVIKHDEPWEGGGSIYHSLFEDPDHYYDYRMYFRASGFEASASVGYAESDDGIDWERPNLTDEDTNEVADLSAIPHSAAVFKDENPAAPADERYKAIGLQGGALHGFVSPDGFDWTPLPENPIITDGRFDSHNTVIWDPVNEEYRAYWRYYDGDRRAIRTARSDDYREWTDATELQYPEASPEQLYTNAVKPYYRAPHIWLGFPARYVERDPDSQSLRELPGWDLRKDLLPSRSGYAITDMLFMSSRDGETFSRAPEAFIPPGLWEDDSINNWIYGDNYAAWQLVEIESPDPERPEELSLYATEQYRSSQTSPGNGASQLRRYSLRVDGFVSMHAPLSGGEFVTKPIEFEGSQLVLNYATSAAGSIRIELQNPGGQPYEGFSLEESPEIFGDDLERAVTWPNADLSELEGDPVRIRFVMSDADLYSFQFRNAPITSPEDFEPTAHYTLDAIESDGTVADASSNGRNATNDGATVAGGLVDDAIAFDGSSGVDTPSLPFEGEMTIAGWVNADAFGGSRYLVHGAGSHQIVLYLRDDKPTVWIATEDGNELVRDPSIPSGEWVHVAGTFDGTTLKLYVDGTLAASTEVSSSVLLDSGECRIGSHLNGGAAFQGRMDDLWFFDRALPEDEVQLLVDEADYRLVAHYPLDSIGSDGTVADASSNGRNATNDGATVAGGLVDNALSFDGSAGVDTPSLPFQNGVSVAGWINADTLDGSQMLFTGAGEQQVVLYLRNDQPTWWIATQDGSEFVRDPSISANEWVHVAGTFDGTTLKLYVDGTLATSMEISSSANLNAGQCRIGSNLAKSNPFQGLIDDLWIYDGALSEERIQALYQRG